MARNGGSMDDNVQVSEIISLWKNKIENTWNVKEDLLALYFENPFCVKRCRYCAFFRGKGFPGSPAFDFYYKSLMPRIIDLYYETLSLRTPDMCYFGGGTANLVSPNILRGILEKVPFFRNIPSKKMEVHPAFLTMDQLDLLTSYGFTDLSVGIQTFNRNLLLRNNRMLFDEKIIVRILQHVMANNIKLNCDVIAYLDTGDFEDLSILKNDLIHLASTYHPSYITIYPLYQLFCKRFQRCLSYQQGQLGDKIEKLIELIEEFSIRYGYHIALFDPNHTKKQETSNNLSICHTLSRESDIITSKSFLYDCSFGECSNMQNVIALGGYGDSPSYSYIKNQIYYTIKNAESNMRVVVHPKPADRGDIYFDL
jgi:coproporphyrinogen III oxidase-like Fe-S oxidoreductase